MAAVVLKEGKDFDGADTCRVVANYLPVYARPRFIRIQVGHVQNPVLLTAQLSQSLYQAFNRSTFLFQSSLELTGTFKMKKVKLVEEGFDPALIRDPLYFLDLVEKKYIALTQEIYNSVISGDTKL